MTIAYTRIFFVVMMILLNRFVSEINDEFWDSHRVPVIAAVRGQAHGRYYAIS